MEKTKGTAIACRIAKIKNIYAFGIGSQKYLINKKVRLVKNDLRYNYSEQSIKFLDKLNVPYNFKDKFLEFSKKDKEDLKKFNNLPKPWVCFGVTLRR